MLLKTADGWKTPHGDYDEVAEARMYYNMFSVDRHIDERSVKLYNELLAENA